MTDMPRTGALTDIRVVDLSRVLAGPLCGQMLADHGADELLVTSVTHDFDHRLASHELLAAAWGLRGK